MTVASLFLASSVFAMQISSNPVENQATEANSTHPLRLTGFNYSNCINSDYNCNIEVVVDKNLNNPFKQSGYFRIYDEADGWRLIGVVAYRQGEFSSDRLVVSMQPNQTRKLRAYLVADERDSSDIYTPTPLVINSFATNPVSNEGSIAQPIALIDSTQAIAEAATQAAARETYSKLENVLLQFRINGYDLSAAALSYYLKKSELPSYFYQSLRDNILTSPVFWQGFGSELFSDMMKSCSTFNGFTTKPLSISFYLDPTHMDLMMLIGAGTVRWEGDYAADAIYPIMENGQLLLDVKKELKIIDIYNFDYEDAAFKSWAFTLGIPEYGYFSPGEIRNLENLKMTRPLLINEPVITRGRYSVPNVCW